MTNEQKIEEIAVKWRAKGVPYNAIYDSCLEMAQWEDEQLESAIDKALHRNGDFLKQGKITQYGYDIAFATIQNIREYLKNQQDEHNEQNTTTKD